MHDRCFSHGAEGPGQSICLKEGKGLWNPFNRWKWQGSRESARILGKSCLSHLNNGTPWFQSRGGCQGISIIPDISNPGFYEVAVIKGNELNWDLLEDFENPVMNDVESGLTLEEAHEIGRKVSELKRNQKIN